jgi:hypothetical protein
MRHFRAQLETSPRSPLIAAAAADPKDGRKFVNPALLSADEKRELLAGIADDSILELWFRNAAYADKPNANSWRINPGELAEAVAKIATAKPPRQLELDHGWGTGARVGAVVAGELVTDEQGVRWLVEECCLVDKMAMANFVRGKLDRFSIGMGAISRITCSVCGENWGEDRWGYLEPQCKHVMGRDGCEAFVSGDIAETSFVLHPAVDGTHVLSRGGGRPMPGQRDEQEGQQLPVEVAGTEDETFKAERAGFEAKIRELEQEKKAMADQLREGALSEWVRERRIFPAELGHYREIWDKLGEAKTRELVGMRVLNVSGYASQAAAAVPSQDKDAGHASSPDGVLELAKDFVRAGCLSRTPTEAEVKSLRPVR